MKTLSVAALSAILLAAYAASPAYADDAAITTQIEAALLDGEGIWSSDIIRVQTIQGMVYLRGYAAAERNRQRAGEIAQSVEGVKQVENDIRVR
jgi:hyperosmotically inducible protein